MLAEAMGRWDWLAEQKPQELKEYALDEAARIVAEELRSFPPRIEEWLDPAVREKYQAALSRPTPPPEATVRVACELARRELLRDYELVDRFFQSGAYRAELPDDLEEQTAHFLARFLVDSALDFLAFGKGKFSRKDLVSLVEKLEERLLRGTRFRL
jgi:AcrR family transcriptional regulator